MTCKQCHNFKQCMAEAAALDQVFDPEYDGEHGCAAKRFRPMTNADRIRGMGDAELARELNLMFKCDAEWQRDFLAWLQQPAMEEGEHGEADRKGARMF